MEEAFQIKGVSYLQAVFVLGRDNQDKGEISVYANGLQCMYSW